MIQYFVDKWYKNKIKLEEYFGTHVPSDNYDSYELILKKIIKYVLNDSERGYGTTFNKDEIVNINYGDYQGTQILTFAKNTCQPDEDETFYTVIRYGSCSGCDTLLGILEYDWGKLPCEEQVKDLMTLALHMIQKIKCFGDFNERWFD